MFCTIPASISMAFLGYLLYQGYQENAQEGESMFANLKNNVVDKKISAAATNLIAVIFFCYLFGFIVSSVVALAYIAIAVGLSYSDII